MHNLLRMRGNGRSAITPRTKRMTDVPIDYDVRFVEEIWRPRPESNRRIRICSPLRHHSATWPIPRACCVCLPEAEAQYAVARNGEAHVSHVAEHAQSVRCRARGTGTPLEASERREMVDFETQRHNMVESQVRPSDVTDRRIIIAMARIARERFLPPAREPLAYSDSDLHFALDDRPDAPVTHLLAPRVLSRLIQYLEIGDADVVLDVGCGPGYSTAVLAAIAQTVVAIDDNEVVAAYAAARLEDAGVDNAVVVHKPLIGGYPEEGPYDAILIGGMVEEVPEAILDQLKDGGRLVAIEGRAGFGAAVQWKRLGDAFDKRWLFDAGAPQLAAFNRPPAFAF
jgi:protein-L-isoaspartate(D-aspartate) O-methyltransferase